MVQLPKSRFNAKQCLLSPNGLIVTYTRKEIATMKKAQQLPGGAIPFDSISEAEYYRDKILPHLGREITEVALQPKFVLLEAFRKYGRHHLPITYTPDFMLTYPNGSMECIDVKGQENERFPLKRKLFDSKYPDIPLLVMKKIIKYGGWITDDRYKAEKSREKKAARKP